MDLDGATQQNGRGWSKGDSDIGNSLAASITRYGPRMTERQWPLVVRLAVRYRGQVESVDPMPAMQGVQGGQATRNAPAPATPPITESPEAEALKREIRAGESRLDALLRDPDGPRCVSRESGGVFGQCGTCGLELGPGQAKRDRGKDLVGKDFAACVALPWIAERRAKLARLRGNEALAREIETDMGLTPSAPVGSGAGGASGEEARA
jgi:hypothetical protein